jgi:hypothetical protein
MHAAEMPASEVPPRPWQIVHWQARRGQVEPDDAHRAPPLCLHYVLGEPREVARVATRSPNTERKRRNGHNDTKSWTRPYSILLKYK